jgi:hypothetical protein
MIKLHKCVTKESVDRLDPLPRQQGSDQREASLGQHNASVSDEPAISVEGKRPFSRTVEYHVPEGASHEDVIIDLLRDPVEFLARNGFDMRHQ